MPVFAVLVLLVVVLLMLASASIRIVKQYEDGVLMLAIPKAETKRQRISIGEGKGTLLGKASQASKSEQQQQQQPRAKH